MVKEFPTLMVINGEEVNIYKEEIEFENLVKFLEPYAAEEKRPHRNWDQFNPDYPEFDIVSLNSDNFELYLTKDKRLTVVHFFTDKE